MLRHVDASALPIFQCKLTLHHGAVGGQSGAGMSGHGNGTTGIERGQLMAEHYHQTYELTYRFWKERNRSFLLLITTLAIAALISFDSYKPLAPIGIPTAGSGSSVGAGVGPNGTRNTFLIAVLCHAITKEKGCAPQSDEVRQLANQFPHDVFDGIISIIVLYLMLNITNLTTTIFRYYHYINRLEGEVRKELDVGRWSVAFSREGEWYQRYRAPLQLPIRYFYVLILTGLLGFYFALRLASELQASGSSILLVSHGLIAILATLALYSYASTILGWSTWKDNQEV
jgi:hypothetical protein